MTEIDFSSVGSTTEPQDTSPDPETTDTPETKEIIMNARIVSTALGFEDFGVFTAFITLEHHSLIKSNSRKIGLMPNAALKLSHEITVDTENKIQTKFGGYAFCAYDSDEDQRIGMPFGAEYMMRLLQTLKIDRWEKLAGTYCRIKASDLYNGHFAIVSIGHILDDLWFTPEAILDEQTEKDQEIGQMCHMMDDTSQKIGKKIDQIAVALEKLQEGKRI